MFREYPYLYDGNIEYEKEYLKRYINSQRSCIVLAYSENDIVGVCTCLPLEDELEEIYAPIEQKRFEIKNILYGGEALVLKSYQESGLSRKFEEICVTHEKKIIPSLTHILVCTVERGNHYLKPDNYSDISLILNKLNYKKLDGVKCVLSWKDIDKVKEDNKSLSYWIRDL